MQTTLQGEYVFGRLVGDGSVEFCMEFQQQLQNTTALRGFPIGFSPCVGIAGR